MNRISGTCGTVTLSITVSKRGESIGLKKNKLKTYWLNFSERHVYRFKKLSKFQTKKSSKVSTPSKLTGINKRKRKTLKNNMLPIEK